MDQNNIEQLANILSKKIDKEVFNKKYAPAKEVLLFVGAGAFIAAPIVLPNLPLALKPFLDHKRKNEYEAWKRFNIPYLKRTILRLERQKLIEIGVENGLQIVKLTSKGRQKILKLAMHEVEINKLKKIWDKNWTLISFNLPEKLSRQRKIFVEYLKTWGFYPIHESVYLHAYSCTKEVNFLKDYLAVGEYIRVFNVSGIENDAEFRSYFGV